MLSNARPLYCQFFRRLVVHVEKIIQFSLLQALLELELNSTDLRSSLRELYISGAKVSFNNLS